MDTGLIAGTETTAPACAAPGQEGPDWAGKRLNQLTKDNLDDMLAYCMRVGRRHGQEDALAHRPVRSNPFHPRYLHGMPWLHYKTFYAVGRHAATEALRQANKQPEQFRLAYA